jgi:hypothetical protein
MRQSQNKTKNMADHAVKELQSTWYSTKQSV